MPTDQSPWRKSSYCANGACVEVADLYAGPAVRDNKDLDQTPIQFDRASWGAFIAEVKAGGMTRL